MAQLEGLGQLKKLNDFIGPRTRDLPACSIVPQPSTLLCALYIKHETTNELRGAFVEAMTAVFISLIPYTFQENLFQRTVIVHSHGKHVWLLHIYTEFLH
jgi:hypothetical protein